MSRERRLLPDAERIDFSNGTSLTVQGGPGEATQWVHRRGALRLPAEEDTNPKFDAALARVGIVPQETLHVDLAPRHGQEAETVILRPASPPGKLPSVQVVLYADESGGISWHFPASERSEGSPGKSTLRGPRSGRGAVFTIPTRTAEARRATAPSPLRGLVTKLGRQVFKILVVPLAAPLLKRPVQWFADQIESRYRQELIRAVTPENYRLQVHEPFTAWETLADQTSLLIIHGIFSSTEGVLSRLPRSALEDLCRYYQGRVIAYDHWTVTKHPEENARYFLEQVRRQRGRFRFDVLCHSRGGIVTRTLAERGDELLPGHNCEFRKAYFVAAPNQGSALGDPRHMLEMVDVFTNLLTSFPDGWATYSLEVLLGLVKLLAFAGQMSLPGIAAMGTEGYIPEVLNAQRRRCATSYAAAAANYRPHPTRDNGFLNGPFADAIMDRVFTREGEPLHNDLVVPCDGVFAANGHPSFPIRDRLVYRDSDHVWHTGFFERPEMLDRIYRHFGMVQKTKRHPAIRGKGGTFGRPARAAEGLRRFRPSLVSRSTRKKAARKRSGPSEPATTIARRPAIEFRERMRAGQREDLVVRLDQVKGKSEPAQDRVELLLEPGQSEITLTVTLSAPGFDAEPASANLVLNRRRDPKTEMTRFRLTARDPGKRPVTREIRADFWSGNRCVGVVTHRTVVVPKGEKGQVPGDGSGTFEMLTVSDEQRLDPDLIIYVQSLDTSGQPPFLVQLRSRVPERLYDVKPVGKLQIDGNDLAKYLDGIYQQQFDRFPDARLYATDAEFQEAYQQWQRQFVRHLQAMGKKFWDLLPAQFHHEYFALMALPQRPRSLLVHSDEMILPWELLIPHRHEGKATGLPPLGCAHILGRWKPGLTTKPIPQRYPIRKFCVVNPRYAGDGHLPWSQREVQELKKLFPQLSVVSTATAKNIEKRVLERADIQMLHYSGHGEYDPANADLNHWILADESPLDSLLIADSTLVREGHPLIYMNACSVGQIGMVIGRMGGFAANLLDNGCSGVIAPYWPVVDRRAMDFSLALYAQLKAQRSIGEALQTLRLENPQDPTFQAFSYFGDPWARAQFAT